MPLIRTLTEDPQFACKLLIENGGRGIRTSGTVPRTAVFKPKNNTHINPRKPTKSNNDAGFSTFALGWFRFFSAEVRAQNQHSLYIRMDSLSVGWTASCCRKDLCRFSRSNPMGFNPMCRFCARGRPPVRHFKHPAHWVELSVLVLSTVLRALSRRATGHLDLIFDQLEPPYTS